MWGCGAYGTVRNWIKAYAEKAEPTLETKRNICLIADNEQKHGKSYTNSLNSTLATSCITTVIAAELNLKNECQFSQDGQTHLWRSPEKNLTVECKEQVRTRALFGRNKG